MAKAISASTVEPEVKVIADNLSALLAIHVAMTDVGWFAEAAIAYGLLSLLADLVRSETPPNTAEHAAAVAILEPT